MIMTGRGRVSRKYLNEHGSPEDIVAVTNGDMVLKFYTKMKVVGGLTGEDLSP